MNNIAVVSKGNLPKMTLFLIGEIFRIAMKAMPTWSLWWYHGNYFGERFCNSVAVIWIPCQIGGLHIAVVYHIN